MATEHTFERTLLSPSHSISQTENSRSLLTLFRILTIYGQETLRKRRGDGWVLYTSSGHI